MHKIDRVRLQPGGGAIVLVEDERTAHAMARSPGLSTVVAVARVLNARRLLAARYASKGEIRYAAAAPLPTFLLDAVTRAGAAVSDSTGEHLRVPAMPAGVSATVDQAFLELAHQLRTHLQAADMLAALRELEGRRRATALDRDANPAGYWTAVFELAALAGELSRSRGGRWIETTDAPVPFAIKFAGGELAHPTKLAQQIVEGSEPIETLATASVTADSP